MIPFNDVLGPVYVKYTVGQPIGALSSWASLALVHHFLVQLAAFRTFRDFGNIKWSHYWFDQYLVLGDDIVISHSEVASSYLEICKDFGIKVGLAKSFVSDKAFVNFANRSILDEDDISPCSIREDMAVETTAGRVEMVMRMIRRG